MRKYQQLSQEERYTIAALSRSRKTKKEIAIELGRHPSTIGRELTRNRTPHDDGYRAEVAHSRATARRRRTRRGSQFSKRQWKIVVDLLRIEWSPEQIADHLKKHYTFSISHETIYQYILRDKKHGGVLYKNLRIMPKVRRKRYNSHDSRGVLPGKRHISIRPVEVESRAVLGHWEGDTVIGSDRKHCLLTLVERKSGYTIIKKLKARTTDEVTRAASEAIREHKRKFLTITFDNGTEFHNYAALEELFPVTCFFATPYHSWERGSNENLNGLIRQYIPKGESMRYISQDYCDFVEDRLNNRPRKRHGFKTPQEIYTND